MRNFKILLLHEFLQQVKSFKFSLMVALSLIVTIFTVYIQVTDFNERFQNYEEEKLKADEEAARSGTFAELNVQAIIPPNPLSIFSKGFDEKAGNKIKISVEDLPELETVAQKKNPFMEIFTNFDIVSIVKIILSLMAIFLIADSIAGEREEETLKLIFVNRVSRLEIFMAKYIAALTAISIPMFVMFLFSAFYISVQPSIQLSTIFWFIMLLIFLSSLIFISTFIFIGLWISIKASSSEQAMIYGLLIWIAVIFIYPNLANYTVSKVVDIPSSEELKAKINQLFKEFGDKLIEDHKKNYPAGRYYFTTTVYSSKIGFTNNENNWFISLPYKSGITSKFKMEFDAGQVKRMIPVLLEYQDKMMDTYDGYRNDQLKQKRAASWLQKLIPGYLLDETTSDLAGTSYDMRVLNILKKARQFRTTYIDYIKTKNGFGPKYFTQIPEELWSDVSEDYNSVVDKYSINNYPRLNLNDIPQFPSVESFKVPPELFFLLLINLALMFMVSRAFMSFSIIKD